MGKNKGGKTKYNKDSAIFKVAGVRKPKIKAVNINLKQLKVHNKSKTDEVDKSFQKLQHSIGAKKTAAKPQKIKCNNGETAMEQSVPDVNQAADDFAKL